MLDAMYGYLQEKRARANRANAGNPVKSSTVGGVVNPWQTPFGQTYTQAAAANPYAAQWKDAVARAGAFGQKDWTADMRRMALEDVNRQQDRQSSTMRAMGMGELSLAPDVQQDWTKQRTDASARAGIQGQEMQRSAMETWKGVLGSATGAELDRIAAMLAAAAGGGANYNQFAQMVIPLLMEKARLGGGTGGPQPAMGGGSFSSAGRM